MCILISCIVYFNMSKFRKCGDIIFYSVGTATVNPACMQRTATTGIGPTTQQTETSIQR